MNNDSPMIENPAEFQIPEGNIDVMVALVEAIPKDWMWVSGMLRAPQSLIDSGHVADNIGFVYERFSSVPLLVERRIREGMLYKTMVPNSFPIVVLGKRPAFVGFENAGAGISISDIDIAQTIITGLLKQGYLGGVMFSCGMHDGVQMVFSAQCIITFSRWGSVQEKDRVRPYPPRIRIRSYPRIKHSERMVVPIIQRCCDLGLEKYVHPTNEEQ